jgi:microcystin-dependent protein
MSLGIRGANPIWAEFDLQGNLFDDTFYLFVLENTIPYAPAIVYHDPDLNVPWTNPIRFLGNGTLPVDIYFESDVVYRLEFRQGPTQADPLIYEVDNYIAGTGGSTPVDTVAFASSNQVTNPQFSLISFSSPFTLGATDPAPIEIGPGWFLELAGTGTVTLTQVPLNNSNVNPSNAPYALRITLTGWTTDSVFLRQRFQQNGMLWANKIVSSTITARVEGAPRTLSASLIDSNNSTLANVLTVPSVNSSWNEFTGYGELPATTNPDVPPAAYIDYKLAIPNNIDIYVTSFQLVVQDLPIEPSFEQDSIDRQIDHTYHTAYPIVPVGTIIDFAGFMLQPHYLICNGAAINRIQYNLLFQALTKTETVSLTSGSPTFTVPNGQFYRIGMFIEGTGVPAATTVSNVVGNTITMSANANATTSSVVRFFAWGHGDGSTTFNTPNLTDYVLAGAQGTGIVAANLSSVGGKVGEATHTQTINEMPSHHHSGLFQASASSTSGPGAFVGFNPVPINTGDTGNGVAFNITQLTAFTNKFIRYE